MIKTYADRAKALLKTTQQYKASQKIGADSLIVRTYALSNNRLEGAMDLVSATIASGWVVLFRVESVVDTRLVGPYEVAVKGTIDGRNIDVFSYNAIKQTQTDLDGTVTGLEWDPQLRIKSGNSRDGANGTVESGDGIESDYKFNKYITVFWADDRRADPISESDKAWLIANPPKFSFYVEIASTSTLGNVNLIREKWV